MWRCVVDDRGYCKGEPEWEQEPHEIGAKTFISKPDGKRIPVQGYSAAGTCKLNPKECNKFQWFHEQVKSEDMPELEGYRHLTPAAEVNKAKANNKPKRTKEEAEQVQSRMF